MKNTFGIFLLLTFLFNCYEKGFSQQNHNEYYQYKFVFQDDNNKSLKDIQIICHPIDIIESLTTTTTTEGELSVVLKPGRYRIEFKSQDGQYIAFEDWFAVSDKKELNSKIVFFLKIKLNEYYIFNGYVKNGESPIEKAVVEIDLGDRILTDTTSSFGRYFVRCISTEPLAGRTAKYSLKYKLNTLPKVETYYIKDNDKIIVQDITIKKKSEERNLLTNYNGYYSNRFILFLGVSLFVSQRGEIVETGLIKNPNVMDFFSLRTIWHPWNNHYAGLDATYYFQRLPIITKNIYETLPGTKGVAEFSYSLENFISIGIRTYPLELLHFDRFLNPYVTISGLYFHQRPKISDYVVDDLLFNITSKPHFTYKIEGGFQVKAIKWAIETYFSFFRAKLETYKYKFNYFGSAESIKTDNQYSNVTFGINIGYLLK